MNKHLNKISILLLFLIASSFSLLAQKRERVNNTDSLTPFCKTNMKKIVSKIALDASPGYLFPSHHFFKGENMRKERINKTLSAHLKYGFQFSKESPIGQRYPNTTQGIGISYNTFFRNSEMGSPIALYLFQTSRIASLTKKLSLDYEWNFGASFGWKKYNEKSNPHNQVVGSKTNAYIHLGFLLNWEIAPQLNLTAGVGLTHFSNGNTKYPNAGVNTLNGRIGIVRTFGADEPKRKTFAQSKDDLFKRHITYDVIVYGAARKKGFELTDPACSVIVPGSFGIVGLNFNPMYNVNKYFRCGLSLDAQYDESANIKDHIANKDNTSDIKFYRPSFREQFSMGLSIRGELVMPIFAINIGIGKNFLCKGDDTNDFYQIFALKAHVTHNAFLHVGYQLYRFKDPNNLMLGIGYRFGSK